MDDPGLAHHYRIALRRPKPIDSLRSQQPLDAASSPVPYQVRYPHVGRCLYPAPARLHCPRRGRKDMVHRSSPARPPARRDARGPPDPNQLKRHGPYAPVFSPLLPLFPRPRRVPRRHVRTSGPRRTQLLLSSVAGATRRRNILVLAGEARRGNAIRRIACVVLAHSPHPPCAVESRAVPVQCRRERDAERTRTHGTTVRGESVPCTSRKQTVAVSLRVQQCC
jgi:hypothetical protein